MPDGADGSYYITIPANVTFTAKGDTADMTVKLHRTDVTKTLNPDLAVQVDVYSANNYSLTNASYTQAGEYELVYTGNGADDDGNPLVNKTPAGPASATAGDTVGSLTPDTTQNTIYDATTNPTGNKTSLVGSITGTAEMTVEPSVDVPGTAFTDKLTYYVTQTNPAVQP